MKPGNSPLILIIFIYCLKVNLQATPIINVYKIKRAYFPKRTVCSLPIRLLLCLEIIIKSFEL